MNTSVKISAINSYHPAEIRDNSYYIKKHPNIKNLNELLVSFGRDKRCIADPDNENVLTMSFKAAKPIVNDSDIDIIIFASTTIEYLSPTHALLLHKELNIKHNCICIDMNTNCLGMLTILEQAAMMLKSKNSYRKALIVSADHVSRYANPNELFPDVLFGDAAVAMVLEKREDNLGAGLIDSLYYTDSQYADAIVFPRHGLSHSQNMQTETFYWGNFAGTPSLPFAVEGIKLQLKNNKLKFKDVRCFFFSQLSKNHIEVIKNELDLSWDDIEYIGDQYGYTGGNSLFVAYESRLKKGLLRDGDLIVFWSLGAGFQSSVVLWRL